MPIHLIDEYKKLFLREQWLSDATFSEAWQTWEAKTNSGPNHMVDFVHQLLENMANTLSNQLDGSDGSYTRLRAAYFHLWKLNKEQEKDGAHYFKRMHYFDLKKADLSSFKTLAGIIATNCCRACEENDGVMIPLPEALLKQPIPQPACTRPGGCICTYGLHGERDLEGKLIWKTPGNDE